MRWEYRYSVLVLCTLAFFVTYFGRLAISPVVPFITAGFDISNAQIGLALTGMWLAYGLAQFPSGVLADRFGEKPIILVAVGGTTAMSLLLAASPLYLAFVAFAVGLGGVAGLHYSVATTLLSRTYDDIGTVLGFHSAGGPVAGLVAPVAAAWVGVRYGWRPAVGLSVLVGVPAFVLFMTYVRPTEPRKPAEAMRDRIDVRELYDLLSRPAIAFTLLIAMLGTYVVQGLLSFLPTFLIEFRTYSAALAGTAFSAFFVVRTVGQIALGRVSDSYGRDYAIAGSMLAGGAGVALLMEARTLPTVGAAVLLVGLGTSFFSAIDPRFLDNLAAEERGTGFGLVRTGYTVVGSTGSLGLGILADSLGWYDAFGVLAALFLLSFLLVVANAALGGRY
jgi:MFS family permease